MAAARDNMASAIPDFENMTKVQKLAALLVVLGPDSAAPVLKSLEEPEIEAVTSEMAKLVLISPELQTEVLREFTEVALQASTSVRGGVDVTQNALEKAVGVFKASNIIGRVAPSKTPVAAMQQIADLEARQVFNLIKLEQPQTIALILSYLSPEKASEVLSLIRAELRQEVLERLATLAPTPIEVVEQVVHVLCDKLGTKNTRALRHTGGLKAAASLLNALDKNVSKALLISIDERNPELGQAIRHKMFTFEDVANLDPASLQRILREVDMRDVAIAMKTASEQLKNAVLGCVSKRAAETLKEEISFMGPLKLRDIDAAQIRIIEVVRRLESEGEVDLGEAGGKKNEALA